MNADESSDAESSIDMPEVDIAEELTQQQELNQELENENQQLREENNTQAENIQVLRHDNVRLERRVAQLEEQISLGHNRRRHHKPTWYDKLRTGERPYVDIYKLCCVSSAIRSLGVKKADISSEERGEHEQLLSRWENLFTPRH